MSNDLQETELGAYLDGELDLERQLAVETYLATHAEAAANLMGLARERTALRLIQGDVAGTTPELTKQARQLSHRLDNATRNGGFRRMLRPATAAVAILALFGVVLLPNENAAAHLPGFVDEAYEAYQTARLRAAMPSQLESVVIDKREILQATRIPVPHMPKEWEVTDIQVFPSDDGPALQLMIDTPTGQLSVFAVRTESDAPASPETLERGSDATAFWQQGEIAYALTGNGVPANVDRIAERFAAGVDADEEGDDSGDGA